MSLFAETSDTVTGILVFISTVIGSGISWLAMYIANRHAIKRKEDKEDEKTIVDHLKEVEHRCNEENKELKAEIKETNKRIMRILNHVMYLEGVLESKGMKFRRLDLDGSGSDLHTPLPDKHKDKTNAPNVDRPIETERGQQ